MSPMRARTALRAALPSRRASASRNARALGRHPQRLIKRPAPRVLRLRRPAPLRQAQHAARQVRLHHTVTCHIKRCPCYINCD